MDIRGGGDDGGDVRNSSGWLQNFALKVLLRLAPLRCSSRRRQKRDHDTLKL